MDSGNGVYCSILWCYNINEIELSVESLDLVNILVSFKRNNWM